MTGVALLDGDKPAVLEPIILDKCKGLWPKVDAARAHLTDLKCRHPQVDHIFIEEPLKNFSSGLSSADTIISLVRFNGIVSFICRDLWRLDPTYINASHARKLVGVKVQRTAVAGKPAKQQTFEHMMNGELSHVVWPTKKSGKTVDWAPDVVDAYVVARAGVIEL